MATFAAGGMERGKSDDSDNDSGEIVYCSPTKTTENYDASDENYVPIGTSNFKNGNIPQKSSNYRHKQSSYQKQQKPQKRQVVVQSSQPLDDLRYAILQNNLEVTKVIIAKGVWVDTILKAGWTGLMYACSSANHEIVHFFLEQKADPNHHKDMFTPLMAVCASTKDEDDLLKCCKYLLEKGAKVNVHERHLVTPLMFAVREGHIQIVRELLKNDADPNACDNRGQTALFWAASKGYGQIIHILLEGGANPKMLDFYGQTAVDLAHHTQNDKVIPLLEKGVPQNPDSNKSCNGIANETPSSALSKTEQELLKANSRAMSNQGKTFTKQGELEIFFNGLGLANLIPLVIENQLTFKDVLIMNDEELEKLGVTQVGIRNKILLATKDVHKKEWAQSSLPNLKKNQYISCPDAVAMVANISKHLKYIASTIVYVRLQIQAEPRILELAKDTANVTHLLEELEDSLVNTYNLNDELRFLKMHLDKVQDNVKYLPNDVIDGKMNEIKKRPIKKTIAFGFIIISITIGGILWKKPETASEISSFIISKIPMFASS